MSKNCRVISTNRLDTVVSQIEGKAASVFSDEANEIEPPASPFQQGIVVDGRIQFCLSS